MTVGAASCPSGDRDCSLQRRNQKVVEEAPAPRLPDALRAQLHSSSRALAASVSYRSAGTVEFIYDPRRHEASFLEVNARLQVEHPVTEAVTGIDLAGWMFRLARGESNVLASYLTAGANTGEVPVRGHAVEARVYAEDPSRDYRPSTGTLTAVAFPDDERVRVDTWVEVGTEVSASYDPLLAKVITAGAHRDEAFDRLSRALDATVLHGIEVNVGMLRAAVDRSDVRTATHSTSTLASVVDPRPRITVERAGRLTTIQDLPGRVGLWDVGVPPSGPMDDLSFRLGNRAVGNPVGAPGLECTASGPALRMTHPTNVCVTGAECLVTVDGLPVPMWEPVEVAGGSVLDVGATETTGLRTYVLVEGGFDVPSYLGSASTFTLGRFGGHGGRQLVVGDVLRAAPPTGDGARQEPVPVELRPSMRSDWELAVTEGPHGAPEFFTRADIDTFWTAGYRVHFNSARTGVRLEGPRPEWARPDGGDAGLHPSNIHDTAYSVGALDFTGDTPILLGPDGPSLGGFVCPVTVVAADRWKLGQLRPGDTVRFVPMRAAAAPSRNDLGIARRAASSVSHTGGDGDDGVLARRSGDGGPAVTYRRNGDDNVLVEYGDMVLDLALRARVHALHRRLGSELNGGGVSGILDLTPGIRSLQVHVDPDQLPIHRLLGLLFELEDELPETSELAVPSRSVRLPLSWDDPATREAIARYTSGVRDDAPWCPSNIEFIRRINGLASQDDVMDIVFSAEYLTLGLGDVYLGAPVATPLDPRHRLVTTKYNPARTWTAENSVGIGGAYLCIYGMEGPGGYQFVGRTTQVWSRYRHSAPFEPGSPWLLRFFDRISWYPVTADELLELRADLAAGRGSVDITEGTFSLADHQRFLADNADSIADFRARQSKAFAAERAAWAAAGEFDRAERAQSRAVAVTADLDLDEGAQRVDAPFASSVWKVDVEVGERVVAGQSLLALEAMKMETVLTAPTRWHRHARARRGRSSGGHGRAAGGRRSRRRAGRAGDSGVTAVERVQARIRRHRSRRTPRDLDLLAPLGRCAGRRRGRRHGGRGGLRAAAGRADGRGQEQRRCRGPADHRGVPGLRVGACARGCTRGGAVTGCGRRRHRRHQPRSVRHGSRRYPQPARRGARREAARAHLRWIQLGLGGGGRARPCGHRRRHGYRRIRPRACRTARHRRGSSPRSVWCRPMASSPRAARTTASRCSPVTSTRPTRRSG